MEARPSEPTAAQQRAYEPEVSGWVGWVFFGAMMMMLLGFFQTVSGITALINDEVFFVARNDLVVNLDFTVWGWVHLILGIAMILVGLGLMGGSGVARVVGVIVAMISAIVNLTFIPAYPWSSILIITVDVLFIYAVTVHGGELKRS
jgi:hypothetical protein